MAMNIRCEVSKNLQNNKNWSMQSIALLIKDAIKTNR